MCVKLLVEHCYNRSPKENIIKTQGRILKNWALGQSYMQRKQRRGRTFPLLQPPYQRQREKNFVSFCMIWKYSGYSSNFKRLVSVKDMKMIFNLMKSHDCHVLMTTLLHVALRGIKTELVRDTSPMLIYCNELCFGACYQSSLWA
jgi:hypothetical protein